MATASAGHIASPSSIPAEIVIPVGVALAALIGLATFFLLRIYRTTYQGETSFSESPTLQKLCDHQNNLRWLEELQNWKELGLRSWGTKKDKRSSELDLRCRGEVDDEDEYLLSSLPEQPPPAFFARGQSLPRLSNRISLANLYKQPFFSKKNEHLQIPEIRITVPIDGEVRTLKDSSAHAIDNHRRWPETFERDINLAVIGMLEIRRQNLTDKETVSPRRAQVEICSQRRNCTSAVKPVNITQIGPACVKRVFSGSLPTIDDSSDSLSLRSTKLENLSMHNGMLESHSDSDVAPTTSQRDVHEANISRRPHHGLPADGPITAGSDASSFSYTEFLSATPDETYSSPDMTDSPTLSNESCLATPTGDFSYGSLQDYSCLLKDLNENDTSGTSSLTLAAYPPFPSSLTLPTMPMAPTSLAYTSSTTSDSNFDGRPQSVVSLSGLKGVRLWTNEDVDLFYYDAGLEEHARKLRKL